MSKRLTLKLDEDLTTKYLDYKYVRIPDYDIEHGNYGRISDDMLYNKLGQLEDIEDELGIDLITLFKALKNGIWVNETTGECEQLKGLHFIKSNNLVAEIDCGSPLIISICETWYEDLDNVMLKTGYEWFADEYGKTWALTKEELE